MGGAEGEPRGTGLSPRFLLDTHVVVRWLTAVKKLSTDQARVLREAGRRREAVAISAITLLEIAMLFREGSRRSGIPAGDLLHQIESLPAVQILPLTVEVAAEVAAIGASLKDPADRAIVATARVHRLRLITSDQRIIESELVPVIT